jgi:hypothetical protein
MDHKHKERIMTRNFTISAAIGVTSIIGLLSFGTTAEASQGVSSCAGKNASSVIACCQEIVAQNGMPIWMRGTSLSCHDIVKCEGKYCHTQIQYSEIMDRKSKSRSRGK